MLFNIITQINGVDLIIAIILVKVCYIAVKTGMVTEAFKLLGVITATYLSLHYFTTLADFMRGGQATRAMTLEFIDFLAFLLLALLGYGFFVFARMAFAHFIKAEAVPRLNKIGGLILGVVRGFLAAGLIVFMLIISSVSVTREMAASSYFGSKIYKISYSLYGGMWYGFFSKVMPHESFNQVLLEIQDNLSRK
jgi:uncharacterized membrane protein required for colicin V production